MLRPRLLRRRCLRFRGLRRPSGCLLHCRRLLLMALLRPCILAPTLRHFATSRHRLMDRVLRRRRRCSMGHLTTTAICRWVATLWRILALARLSGRRIPLRCLRRVGAAAVVSWLWLVCVLPIVFSLRRCRTHWWWSVRRASIRRLQRRHARATRRGSTIRRVLRLWLAPHLRWRRRPRWCFASCSKKYWPGPGSVTADPRRNDVVVPAGLIAGKTGSHEVV